ncbi:MAG: hypothetical protein AABX84_01935 [Nanoarchaeota archaeon]
MAKKKVMRKKKPPYALGYGISVIISLILDYFFVSMFNVHPTIHVAVGFLTFTVVIAIFISFFEK